MPLTRSSRFAFALAQNAVRRPAASPASALAAYRLLSTTARRSLAEPLNNVPLGNEPINKTANAPDYLGKGQFGNKAPPLGSGMASAGDEPGKEVDPYKDGPSALDKAAHLFFFTEIIRGAYKTIACGWNSC